MLSSTVKSSSDLFGKILQIGHIVCENILKGKPENILSFGNSVLKLTYSLLEYYSYKFCIK